jgi:hypothetical protein
MIGQGRRSRRRLGLPIVVDDETVDDGLKIDDAREGATLEPTLGEDGEEVSNPLQHDPEKSVPVCGKDHAPAKT